MKNEPHSLPFASWKAQRATRRSRILGMQPAPQAGTVQPRQRTLLVLARHTCQRPQIDSLLAEAAATMGRWER